MKNRQAECDSRKSTLMAPLMVFMWHCTRIGSGFGDYTRLHMFSSSSYSCCPVDVRCQREFEFFIEMFPQLMVKALTRAHVAFAR